MRIAPANFIPETQRGKRIIIPHPVPVSICLDLHSRGHAAYLVGGAVRDLLRGLTPSDWDIATSARPEEVLALFPGSLPTGLKYGTVTVRCGGLAVEVTTFRGDDLYSDGRHPDQVHFTASIGEDLARRDFTVNAMAFDPRTGHVLDPFGGWRDLRRKILRTVGDPCGRFNEDALRMLRLYRFAATLGFRPATATERAVRPELLDRISAERIRDEFSKILVARHLDRGLRGLAATGLLAAIIPELYDCEPAGPPLSPVAKRDGGRKPVTPLLRHSIAAAVAVRAELRLRLAALLHDLGKSKTRAVIGGELHFYGHDEAGAAMSAEIMARLRYPRDLSETVTLLIRLHMFQLPAQPSTAALRRLLNKAGGADRLRDLIELRRADIIAKGHAYWRAAQSWRELADRVEEVIAAGGAPSQRDLVVDGEDVMRVLGLAPGPAVGRILARLHQMVLEDPALNEREKLLACLERMTIPPAGEGQNGI